MPNRFSHEFRNAIRAQLISQGIIGSNAYVVIAGPANTYGHYVTTREEYGIQRYEGASTIFGPCRSWDQWIISNELISPLVHQDTLESYIDKYTSLLSFLQPNVTITPSSDAAPAEQTSKAISLRVCSFCSYNLFLYDLTTLIRNRT